MTIGVVEPDTLALQVSDKNQDLCSVFKLMVAANFRIVLTQESQPPQEEVLVGSYKKCNQR